MTVQAATESVETHSDERPTAVRYVVLFALGLAAANAYLTRVLSAAATTIQRDFQVGDEDMGYVLAGFAFGYFWFQVPGGWLANRFGSRRALPAMSLVWSLCTIWSSMATSGFELHCSRIAVGLAQAGLVPCCAKVLSDWFPDRERGMAGAAVTCSMQVGALVASGFTAILLPLVGWRLALGGYSALGILWAIGFYIWFRNRPEEHRSTNQAEQHLIRVASAAQPQSQPPQRHSTDTKTLLLTMLTSGSLWAVCCQAFFRAFGYEFFTTWFPAYLEKGHGVKVMNSGLLGMIPLLGFGLGCLFGGWLVDALLVWTGSRWLSRSGTAAVALGLCALSTLVAAWARTPLLAVLVISSGSFFAAIAGPATWAATLDISGKHTAVVFGIMNMIGNIGSFACPIALGYLFAYIQQHSANWNLVLYLFVAVYLAGTVCWLMLNPNRSAVEVRAFPETSH